MPIQCADADHSPSGCGATAAAVSNQAGTARHCSGLKPSGMFILAATLTVLGGGAAPPAAGSARRDAGAAVEPATACSPLAIIRVPEKDRAVAVLGHAAYADDSTLRIESTKRGLILRELIRQAMLIAARDELGLATCDAELGEPAPSAPRGPDATVCSVFRDKGNSQISIQREADGKKRDALLDTAVREFEIVRVAKTAEGMSRNEFPAVLRKLGAEGKRHAQRADAPLPTGVEDRMSRMSYVDQLAALRTLHEVIRKDGESPVRLGAVARCYALLGVLTEHLWNTSHKAFKARALLYAERLVVQDPKAPLGLWNRAFVRALVGLHAEALDDLAEAGRLAREKSESPPAWIPLIDAFVHYDVKAIATDLPSLKPLASILQLFAVEFPWSRIQTLESAQPLLKTDPDCFRAMDAICQVGGIDDLHAATQAGPLILEKVVPAKLVAIEGIPAEVRAVITRSGGEPALVAALRKAGDPRSDAGEPSWGVFGHLIAETRFVHVWRRLSFMRFSWGVPVDEYWNESRLLVSGHPFRPYLESLTLDPAQADEVIGEFARTIDLSHVESKEEPAVAEVSNHVEQFRRRMAPQSFAAGHADQVVYDATRFLFSLAGAPWQAKAVLQISPFSPYARASLIERDWEAVKERADAWKKDASGDSPTMLAAFAKRDMMAGRIDDAQKALRRYVALLPEFWAYQMLAQNEKDRGNVDGWRQTLEEFIEKGADSGLDAARARVDIADYLKSIQRWDEALPYAEAAAETWAAWAMECAASCNEGLADYGRVEFWSRNMSERYANMYMTWFLCCKRTHRGDVAAATDLAVRYIKQSAGRLSETEISLATLLFDLANEPAEGVAILRAVPTPAPLQGTPGERFSRWLELLFLAHFADASGEKKLRDETWVRLEKLDDPAVTTTLGLLRRTLKAEPRKEFDRQAFDAVLKSTDPLHRCFLAYFVACFLARHGQLVEAVDYWDRSSIQEEGGNTFLPMLASNALVTSLNPRKLDDPKLLLRRAWGYRRANELDLARLDVQRIIELTPNDFVPYNLLGVIERAAGNLDDAAAAFSKVIELAPNQPLGYMGHGVVRVLQTRDDEAKKDFERCIELAPKASEGYCGLSYLALAQGRDEESLRLFDQAIALEPSDAQTIRQLRKLVRDHRRSKPE
ncbi:MAG: hypothetical protein P4L84_16775 [Isosphaeraceae bacterium]|nr:hypothetical protein [Isosphaeraceae bacterium]